ncbi:nitroreductase [Orenia metallireducens]|uniref:Nitroreductase n=1 Tax=Orenia metallireducens TaxID=1413210 RepID=A0A285I8X1_9FIRM|nr:nitroreductase family protein [Orenia metallireducens]PRX21689.1 nitroreductase [Orenia metallireducens]SNY44414.1 Nitroreductase [Orenia metallireducens]
MNTLRAIIDRRSIRKFQNKNIPQDMIAQLLELAIKAPSGKNRQPWRFIVLRGQSKRELVKIMNQKVKLLKKQNLSVGSSELSINAISEAPVVILVFNPFSKDEQNNNHNRLLMDTQSIGAAIQTMLLAAQDIGLATLWICDVFYSKREICSWLNRRDELIAAVAIGYANQSPFPRPRKDLSEVVEWLD